MSELDERRRRKNEGESKDELKTHRCSSQSLLSSGQTVEEQGRKVSLDEGDERAGRKEETEC